MTTKEREYLNELDEMSIKELSDWILSHLHGILQVPSAPYTYGNETVNIPQRTIEVLNVIVEQKEGNDSPSDYDYRPVLIKLELAAVAVLQQEISILQPSRSIIFHFIYLFSNIPPHKAARQQLIETLIPPVASGKWKTAEFTYGRNLHYDAFELLAILCGIDQRPFLAAPSVSDYLTALMPYEKNARFSFITLQYFLDKQQYNDFFKALNHSLWILPYEKMAVLEDQLIVLYRQNPNLSFGYMASWLASRQTAWDENVPRNLQYLYRSTDLLALLEQKLQEHPTANDEQQERCYLISLLLLMQIGSEPSSIQPERVEEFFRFESIGDARKQLRDKYLECTDEFSHLLYLLKKKNYDAIEYWQCHVGTLFALANAGIRNPPKIDPTDQATSLPPLVHFRNGHYIIIQKGNQTPIRMLKTDIPATYNWLDTIDRVINSNIPIHLEIESPEN